MIKFTFLVENKTYSNCNAEFGLSILIETSQKNILFDTGASSMLVDNARHCHKDLKEVDAVVLSHGHYDHTGGVPAFCGINEKANIYVHKNAFKTFYGETKGKLDKHPCGILWTENECDSLKNRIEYTDGPLWISDDIVISGSIPFVDNSLKTENFYIKNEDGTFSLDDMSHEQFLAIRNGDRGIFVFSGCSHTGVFNVLTYAKKLFPGEKITAFIAGMHLFSATEEIRERVTEKMSEEKIDIVMPVHCTGLDAIIMLKNKMGERCLIPSSGDRYEYL